MKYKKQKNTKKILKKIGIGITSCIFSFTLLIGNINTYAQNANSPEICFTPAEEFVQFKNFMKDAIRVIQNREEKEENNIWKIPGNWLFNKKILKYPQKSINLLLRLTPNVKQETENVINTMTSLAISSFFTLREGALKDSWGSLFISTREWPFNREYDSLQNIDELLQNLIFELGTEGKRTFKKTLEEKTRNELNQTFKKYQGTGDDKIFTNIFIKRGITYPQFFGELLKLNSGMKTFIAISRWSPQKVVTFFKKKDKDTIEDKINLKFNETTIEKMAKQYFQVQKSIACAPSLKDRAKNLKILKALGNDVNESAENIKKARNRFLSATKWLKLSNADKTKWVSNEIKEYLNEDQIKTLRNIYGIDAGKLLKSQAIGLSDVLKIGKFFPKNKKNSDALTNTKEKIKNGFGTRETTGNGTKKNTKTRKEIREEIRKNRKEQRQKNREYAKDKESTMWKRIDEIENKENSLQNQKDEKNKEELANIFNTILVENYEQQTQGNILSAINDTTSITRIFREIGGYIKDTKEIIGDNNSRAWLNKTLVNICERQCKNKGTKSCKWEN